MTDPFMRAQEIAFRERLQEMFDGYTVELERLKKLVVEAWASDRIYCPVCDEYLITSFHKPNCKLGIILGELEYDD